MSQEIVPAKGNNIAPFGPVATGLPANVNQIGRAHV